MTVDVIMLARGATGHLRSMTQQAINSIHASERDIQFNIIVVETINEVTYKHCTVIHPDEKFNYNKFTKIGINNLPEDSEYVFFVNNDIHVHKDCAKRLMDALLIYDTVSPANPMIGQHKNLKQEYTEGFNIWHGNAEFCGWAIMMKSDLAKENKERFFPDEIEAWYSDNWLTDVLRNDGYKHALVKFAKLDHFESKTLKSISKEEHDYYTKGQKENYDKLLGGLE